MRLFDGKKEAENILSQLEKKITAKISLAVICVGKNKSSELFIRNKKKMGKEAGVNVLRHDFKADAKEEKIISKIKELNKDPLISGIIVQLPLSKGLSADRIIGEIAPKKDVDGFCKGRKYFDPPLPAAIFLALERAGYKGKKALAIVNSDIFGESLKLFLKKKKVKIAYLKRSQVQISKLKAADIIISVCGVPGLIKGDMIKEGAAVIDGGIKIEGKKILGDAEKKSVAEKASFLSPVPGGLGPVNVALLLKNVFYASRLLSKTKFSSKN